MRLINEQDVFDIIDDLRDRMTVDGYCAMVERVKALKEANESDLISKAMVCEILADIYPTDGEKIVAVKDIDEAYEKILQLPSAQPERTCVNCGRTINNGGWYADGRTRCPIEEHYALPKDGYCHLWEKRNVTDDDYPERREE